MVTLKVQPVIDEHPKGLDRPAFDRVGPPIEFGEPSRNVDRRARPSGGEVKQGLIETNVIGCGEELEESWIGNHSRNGIE